MEYDFDVIVVGGGLAGLTSALHLALEGYKVLVFEKDRYPHHKVCGEYVSNEVLPYLENLGVFLNQAKAISIDMLRLSTVDGRYLDSQLPLGGQGISRYALDNLLYQQCIEEEVSVIFETVSTIEFQNSIFKVVTSKNRIYTSTIVIGGYGKRSNLDKHLNREFIQKKSAWMAVKSHYEFEGFPETMVALHNFQGGYGGLSKTESGAVNFCYLASYESFQKEKDITNFNQNVVSKNPFLSDFLKNAKPLFERPLTIAQVSFHSKKAVENHVLMCGDTAGLIHPLCGNGMAMAIHSAKIAAELVHKFLNEKRFKRTEMEIAYQKQWNGIFRKRLWAGRQLQRLLLNHKLSTKLLSLVVKQPKIVERLIALTHGKPID